MTKRIAIAGLTLAVTAGCGGSSNDKAAEAAAQVQQGAQQLQQGAEQMAKASGQSAEQMAQGLQQMAQGFQQMAQGAAKPVAYEELKALVPEVSGWTRGEVRGEQQSMGGFSVSRAETRYRRDDSSIELEITDTALSQLLLAPMSMFLAAGYEERSDDGFKRSTKIGGHPGVEEWNVKSKRGEVTTLVANRFIVKGTGRDISDLAPVRELVSAVGLAKLAALK